MIMNAIPLALKHAITMGTGPFAALTVLVRAGSVHQGTTQGTPGPAP
jgi:AGZA family xanthine/uracil permease-like MFS transporter